MLVNRLLKVSLSFSILLLSSICFSQPSFIMIRDGESDLAHYCKIIKCNGIDIIETDTREFDNGNTFVRFTKSVAGKDIVIVSPRILNADQFMELLIKVRTSRTDFSNSVSVVTADKTSPIMVVDNNGQSIINENLVFKLLADSGADKFNAKKIKTLRKNTRVKTKENSIVVDLGLNSSLAKEMAKSLSIPLVNFDNSSLELLTNKNIILISSLPAPHNLSFLKTIEAINNLKVLGNNITLLTPYLPYARSDKKDQMGVSIIGRLAADMIESAGTDSVSFVRAHAPQSQGFFKIPTLQTMGRKTINEYLKEQGVEQIISPDAGFQKDATLYADELGVPVAVINKQRDLQTGESKLHDMSGPNVAGKIVAVIDDETASGGTLAKAAEFLNKKGAKKVITVVTHLAGGASKAIESPYIDSMAVTDTFEIKMHHPKLKVLSLTKELSRDLTQALNLPNSCLRAYKEYK